MKKIILLLFILTLYGCSKTEDDTDYACTSDCTTLQGRFITLDNEGVSGVKISIEHKIGGGIYPAHIRKIAETTTDENGNFYKEFYIEDSELGTSADGYFLVKVDDSNLNVDNYILTDNLTGTTTSLDFGIPYITTRDTIIGNTFYIPKKAYITVNLNNFNPIQEGDYFEVRTLYPFGPNIGNNDFLDSEYSTGFSGYGAFQANGQNTQQLPFVAENEGNIIRIARRKNGVNTIEDFPVFVPSNNSIELNYDY